MAANWWGISAQFVAWLGIAVIALAIIGPWIKQRIKRRRRCPKCWYDMSHSPGTTCSECGFTAKRDRKLFKARRRWRFAFLGVFMLIGAYALNVTPAVKDRGWPAAVPTTFIVWMLPLAGEDRTWNERTRAWEENLYSQEMGVRLERGALYDWQLRWAIERCRVVRTREAWPIETPFHVGLFLPAWLPDQLHATPQIPGDLACGTRRASVELGLPTTRPNENTCSPARSIAARSQSMY